MTTSDKGGEMAAEPHNDDNRDDNRDDACLRYLIGESPDASLDPFDQAELDAMLATLSDPLTWDDPPSDLGDRIVGLIADDAWTAGTAGTARAATVETARTSAARSGTRRRFGWVGPALLGAAAAGLIAAGAAVVTRDDSADKRSFTADATITLVGTDLAPGVSGTAEVEAVQSGLWIRLDLPGLPRRDGADFYEAWLRSEDGEGLVPIGTFHEGDDIVLWAGVSIEDYPIITVTRESVAGPQAPEQGSAGEVVARGQLTP